MAQWATMHASSQEFTSCRTIANHDTSQLLMENVRAPQPYTDTGINGDEKKGLTTLLVAASWTRHKLMAHELGTLMLCRYLSCRTGLERSTIQWS